MSPVPPLLHSLRPLLHPPIPYYPFFFYRFPFPPYRQTTSITPKYPLFHLSVYIFQDTRNSLTPVHTPRSVLPIPVPTIPSHHSINSLYPMYPLNYIVVYIYQARLNFPVRPPPLPLLHSFTPYSPFSPFSHPAIPSDHLYSREPLVPPHSVVHIQRFIRLSYGNPHFSFIIIHSLPRNIVRLHPSIQHTPCTIPSCKCFTPGSIPLLSPVLVHSPLPSNPFPSSHYPQTIPKTLYHTSLYHLPTYRFHDAQNSPNSFTFRFPLPVSELLPTLRLSSISCKPSTTVHIPSRCYTSTLFHSAGAGIH